MSELKRGNRFGHYLNGTNVDLKWCPQCKQLQPRFRFNLCKTSYDGLQGKCSTCQKLWYANNKERHAISTKKWAKNHPAKMLAYTTKFRELKRDRVREIGAAYAKRHPEIFAAKAARRRLITKKACPLWANTFFISEIYDLARLRTLLLGERWSVDHIVPLQSSIVCGLHVENNLRVITEKENSAKHNKYWPDMP